MKFAISVFACLLAFFVLPGAVSAESGSLSLPEAGRFNFTPHAGTSLQLEGTFVGSATETQVLNTQVGGSVFSTNLGFVVHEQSFADVFHRPHTVGIDINYGLSPMTEVFGGVSYTRAEAQAFEAIDVTFTGTVDNIVIVASSRFRGEFRDYQEYAASLGIRRFFDRSGPLKPYVSAAASLRHVPRIDLKLFDERTGVQVDDIGFYEESLAFAAGLRVGVRFDVTEYAAIGLETGISYLTDLREDDDHLTAFRQFSKSNNDSDRFEVPLTLRAVVRF